MVNSFPVSIKSQRRCSSLLFHIHSHHRSTSRETTFPAPTRLFKNMASNKHGAPAPVVSSPEPVNRPLGFLVFSEVRGCKLDTDPEKQAAFDDDKRLEKEVEAYNQSITKARTIRYNVLLEMSRLNRKKLHQTAEHYGHQLTFGSARSRDIRLHMLP